MRGPFAAPSRRAALAGLAGAAAFSRTATAQPPSKEAGGEGGGGEGCGPEAMRLAQARPTTQVHVSPTGDDGGDGSPRRPLRTISAAVQRIGPGVAVMVHAGTYAEGVKLPSRKGGTPGAPFQILSADGPGAAKIVVPDPKLSGIKGLGAFHVVVRGFEISGGQNGVQFSASGSDFTALCSHLLVQGCHVHDVGEDGIKVSQADDVHVLGNRVHDCGQQCVDFLNVWGGEIVGNDMANPGVAAAVFAKGGSKDILIADNHVHDVTAAKVSGIAVGGWTGAGFTRPGSPDAEAQGVVVRGNRVERIRSGGPALSFLGAADAHATDNYLESDGIAVVGAQPGSPHGAMTLSRDVTVTGNVVVGKVEFLWDRKAQDPGRDRLSVAGNRRGGDASAWPRRGRC